MGRVDNLTLFLPCLKQKTFLTIVELYFHLTMRRSVWYGFLEETSGTTMNFISGSDISSGSTSWLCRLVPLATTGGSGTIWGSVHGNWADYCEVMGQLIFDLLYFMCFSSSYWWHYFLCGSPLLKEENHYTFRTIPREHWLVKVSMACQVNN